MKTLAFSIFVQLLPGYLLVKFSVDSLGFVLATKYPGQGPDDFQMFDCLLFSVCLFCQSFRTFTLICFEQLLSCACNQISIPLFLPLLRHFSHLFAAKAVPVLYYNITKALHPYSKTWWLRLVIAAKSYTHPIIIKF